MDMGATDLSSPNLSALPSPDLHRPRLSTDRLPPVMYNAISEESSPYSSLACSRAHTPFSSNPHLCRGSSGNLACWAQHAQQGFPGQQHACPPQPHRLSGVSVALQLQGWGGRRSSGGLAEEELGGCNKQGISLGTALNGINTSVGAGV